MAKPEVRVVPQSIVEVDADAILVNLFEGVEQPGGATGAVDEALGGAIRSLIESKEFTGKAGQTALLHSFGKLKTGRVVVVGLGKANKFDIEGVRRASAKGVLKARESGAERIATVVHGAGIGGLDTAAAARATVEGALLALYEYLDFKKPDQERKSVRELMVAEKHSEKMDAVVEGARVGRIMAEAANLARDLANCPPNRMTPGELANAARQVAGKYGLGYEVLEREDMEKLGMGALLGVAQGSAEPPKMVVLKYEGKPGAQQKLALVGKGITFDTGGICIKPAEGMQEMKFDMSGAAAVIAAMSAIAQLKPDSNVIGVIPTCENMPSGAAQRPGDVVKAMNGKTIEVINTDAEGRLILADAVAYANTLGATHMVDVATLTGACVIALGHHCTGMISNNDEWAKRVKAAADAAGERVWQFPVFPEYKKQYESTVADIKNIGGRPAGTITGGLIIGEFVGDTPWAHLDIAGTAWDVSDVAYYADKGATGVAARTLAQLAMQYGES